MIDLWFDQPVWAILALLAGLLVGVAAVIRWVTFGRWTRPWALSLAGVVAPFFSSIAILFGLLTGFVANDAWDRTKQASRAILTERDALVGVHDLSVATVSDMSAIRGAERRYIHSVINDEWQRMRDGQSSAEAAQRLGELLREVSDPKITTEAGQPAHAALLDLSLKVRSARSDRLALSQQQSDETKWLTVLILAVLTELALGLVHLERARAQLAALLLFSAAATTALGLIAIRERPFDGPLRLSDEPLRQILAEMETSKGPEAPP